MDNAAGNTAPHRASTDRWVFAGVLLFCIAAGLRIAGMFDDFWFDEIWSLQLAELAHRPADIIFSPLLRVDNNHPLNTLVLYLLREHRAQWWIMRVPSVLAGIATIPLAAAIAARRGRPAALLTLALVGFSYPLIHYSSEARGYALCVLFALLAFDQAERYLERPRLINAGLFAMSCGLGWLSHITFTHVYLGIFAWTVLCLARSSRPGSERVRQLLQLHLAPLCFVASIYWTFIRHLAIGGFPDVRPEQIVLAIGDLVWFHGPRGLAWVIALSVLAGLIIVTVILIRRRDDRWMFVIVALVVSPAALIVWQILRHQMPPVAPRYFLVLWPFALLAAAEVLAGMLRHKAVPRAAAIGVVAIFVAANLWQTFQFLSIGRGHYRDAVQFMMESTPSRLVVAIADHPARTRLPLEFYGGLLTPLLGQSLAVIDDQPGHPPAQWIVLHSDGTDDPPRFVTDAASTTYELVRRFPSYGYSGFTWSLYRRTASRSG